ncbi:MAG: hypothetical protein ABWX90_04145 [Candidatus Saccharimonadales bacterium]
MTIRGIELTTLLSEVTVPTMEMTCEQVVAALAARMTGCFTDAMFANLSDHDQRRDDVELRKKEASTNHEKETIAQDYRAFKAVRDEAYDDAALALKKLITDNGHAEERKLLERVGGSSCRRSALRDVVHLLVDDWRRTRQPEVKR